MAIGAGRGSGFVIEHEVAVDRLLQGVASRASYFLMTSLERKRSLFVIEERGASTCCCCGRRRSRPPVRQTAGRGDSRGIRYRPKVRS